MRSLFYFCLYFYFNVRRRKSGSDFSTRISLKRSWLWRYPEFPGLDSDLTALENRLVVRQREEAALAAAAAGDGGDEHDLVAVLELVGVAAEEADVLVIDVHVDELAEVAAGVLDVLGERGELGVELGEEAGEVFRFAVEGLLTVGVAGEGGGQGYLHAHRRPPANATAS